MQYQIGPPPMNPVARLLAAIVGAVALVGAFFFGFIIFAVAVAAGLVLWLVVWLRIWWLRRKFAAQAGEGQAGSAESPFSVKPERGDAIDAEYEVISREQDSEKD